MRLYWRSVFHLVVYLNVALLFFFGAHRTAPSHPKYICDSNTLTPHSQELDQVKGNINLV